MKKRKPPGPVWTGQKQSMGATADGGVLRRGVEQEPLRSSATEPTAPCSEQAMAGPERAPRRVQTRGRLDRTVLVMLGKGLEDCFDEIRKQEVPERFKLLLQQF
jgi:hypothetical protein